MWLVLVHIWCVQRFTRSDWSVFHHIYIETTLVIYNCMYQEKNVTNRKQLTNKICGYIYIKKPHYWSFSKSTTDTNGSFMLFFVPCIFNTRIPAVISWIKKWIVNWFTVQFVLSLHENKDWSCESITLARQFDDK
jgi:hypothetical protein